MLGLKNTFLLFTTDRSDTPIININKPILNMYCICFFTCRGQPKLHDKKRFQRRNLIKKRTNKRNKIRFSVLLQVKLCVRL